MNVDFGTDYGLACDLGYDLACGFDDDVDAGVLALVCLPPVVIALLCVLVIWILGIWHDFRLEEEWRRD